jgi:hypothetical protein
MIIRVIAPGVLLAGKRAFLQLLLRKSSVSLWQAMAKFWSRSRHLMRVDALI